MTQWVSVKPPANSASLAEWLEWLETIHPVSIDMGLDRVSAVADRLELHPVQKPLVLVGGTNGKGSTVAMLSAMYQAAGFRVGAYSSPHIHDFRERICINGEMAEAWSIVDALAYVETGRQPQTLTYFEYTTLAAMRVFQQHECDVYLMEVGLGGRLDATNLWDADCAVVASIALDHQEFLGSDLSVIATEKAAIGRPGKTLIVGEPNPPSSLFDYARTRGIIVNHVGGQSESELPQTALPGAHQKRNAACAVAVVDTLQEQLPVAASAVADGLQQVQLAARFDVLEALGVTVVFDVAHNPAAASALKLAWQTRFPDQQAQLVFACLGDKDITGLVEELDAVVNAWHCVDLPVPRAVPAVVLHDTIQRLVDKPVAAYVDVESACRQAIDDAQSSQQLVLVAGSFHTVGAVRNAISAIDSVQPCA